MDNGRVARYHVSLEDGHFLEVSYRWELFLSKICFCIHRNLATWAMRYWIKCAAQKCQKFDVIWWPHMILTFWLLVSCFLAWASRDHGGQPPATSNEPLVGLVACRMSTQRFVHSHPSNVAASAEEVSTIDDSVLFYEDRQGCSNLFQTSKIPTVILTKDLSLKLLSAGSNEEAEKCDRNRIAKGTTDDNIRMSTKNDEDALFASGADGGVDVSRDEIDGEGDNHHNRSVTDCRTAGSNETISGRNPSDDTLALRLMQIRNLRNTSTDTKNDQLERPRNMQANANKKKKKKLHITSQALVHRGGSQRPNSSIYASRRSLNRKKRQKIQKRRAEKAARRAAH